MQQQKLEIIQHIEQCFEKYRYNFREVNKWSSDSFDRLSEFISRGKLIRGILVVSSYRALGGIETEKILHIASSIELLHAGFLMHDDVMDKDEFRRGRPSVHVTYGEKFGNENCSNAQKNGESFAICLGNIAYFLAFDQIADSGFSNETIIDLTRILNREAVVTGFGQMNDIYTSSLYEMPESDIILNTYKAKTARYTFSLPLSMGSLCAGAKKETIENLIKIGEEIGTVFQLRDDELNLFGSTEGIGKSVGGDIFEGKKTLIFSILLKNIEGTKKDEVLQIFAKKNITIDDIEKLKSIIISSGTLEIHRKLIMQISDMASELIRNLSVTNEYKNILNYILKLSYERKF